MKVKKPFQCNYDDNEDRLILKNFGGGFLVKTSAIFSVKEILHYLTGNRALYIYLPTDDILTDFVSTDHEESVFWIVSFSPHEMESVPRMRWKGWKTFRAICTASDFRHGFLSYWSAAYVE